jgi:hypothetical protein
VMHALELKWPEGRLYGFWLARSIARSGSITTIRRPGFGRVEPSSK